MFWKELVPSAAAYMNFKLFAGVVTFPSSYFIDQGIAEMTSSEWLNVRIIFNVVQVVLCFFCGALTDILRRAFSGIAHVGFRKAIAEGSALSIYQTVTYVPVASYFGQLEGVLQSSLIYTAMNFLLGWIFYGRALDRFRIKFK